MYLSKIEIIGFKSFAQRVNLNFDAGVTAIVGPNGCGKTNIVDAIRWALGEQRYSTLRSDKMEDVIFNGTKLRKPLGLSEVSLTIENTKGILPTDYSEVTITRRVFRSGESEYLLNKVPCRLKDIVDLFMDTGMGSDAYSVIELKMVETILSDKTDERRRLFEEAAGVTKYKFRRKAAIRKLEDVRQDLARVNDIVKEIQKTVSSLERQAKKAEQYNEVSGRLKALEIDLLEREYAYLHAKVKPLEERLNLTSADRTKIDTALKEQEDRIDQLRSTLTDLENQLEEVQRDSTAAYERIHQLEEKILISKERKNSLVVNIERYEKEKNDLNNQERIVGEEKISLAQRLEECRSELGEIDSVFAKIKDEYRILTESLEEKKDEHRCLKENIFAAAQNIIGKRGELDRAKARADNFRGRIDRSTEENTLYREDITRVEEEIKSLTLMDRDLRKRFAEAEVHLSSKQQEKENLRLRAEDIRREVGNLEHDLERKVSKIEFLNKMIEGSEGSTEGVLYFLRHAGWKEKNIVTVADIIHTEGKYRIAVEAALGEIAHVLVVRRTEDGYAAIEELKSRKRGQAAFVSLEWVPKISRKRRMKADSWVWASDIVHCEKIYRPLIQFLLDDVAIIEKSDDVGRLARQTVGVRWVSTEGQIVTTSGFMKGGSRRIDEGGLIGKKSQIADLEKEITEIQSRISGLTDEGNSLQKIHDGTTLEAERGTVKAFEKEMAGIEMKIAQLEFEKKHSYEGIERNDEEVRLLGKEVESLRDACGILNNEIADLEAKKHSDDLHAEELAAELHTIESQWNDKGKAVNDIEIKLVTLQSEEHTITRDIERSNARVDDIRLTLIRRDEEISRAEVDITRLMEDVAHFDEDLAGVRNEYNAIEGRKQEINILYVDKRNELHEIELRIKDERRLHDDSVETVHDLEMKISEIRSNIDHICQRAQEEFELTLTLKSYPEDEWVDFAHLREEVRNLKERIRILGAINFAAFDEFNSESGRLNFLSQQRDDLLDAEKTLLNTIDEINTTAQRKFSETFSKIRLNFITIFKELFQEGDECDLKLEEGVDPLEAGIEIIAKPRGKRPTSIDLLSGGEKTLTAIALLFAIYLVKPSPFCILDEVDAPLDDSNIDRFTKILKKFSDNTQFIVVTHNKRTMESAQALYGVTMEEEGVSKIVTVRFNEEARIRSATVNN